MSEFEFNAGKNIEEVLAQLKLYGIACVPGYLGSEVVERLNSEFEDILTRKSPSILAQTRHPGNTDGRVTRFNPWHPDAIKDFPHIAGVFNDDFMREISRMYFAPHAFDFNDEVFITHELPCETPSLPWHFDRVQALKFWFNLTDTTARDGAFEYCPGTHWEGRYRVGYYLSQGYGIEDIPNDIDEELIRNPVTLELKAGDLLIFDPDGFHRSSRVFEGGEQRVLRAHTHPAGGRRYSDKKFSPGWWLRSKLNINKWTGDASFRILGDKIQDRALNRKKNKMIDH